MCSDCAGKGTVDVWRPAYAQYAAGLLRGVGGADTSKLAPQKVGVGANAI